MGTMKNPSFRPKFQAVQILLPFELQGPQLIFAFVDHHAHFERFLEARNFIVVQATSLKIATLDISGLLFLVI